MVGIRWIEHNVNEEVLDKISKKRTTINAIIKIKTKLIRHLLRHNQFIIITIEEEKIVNELEEDHVNYSLKNIFQRIPTSYRQLDKPANKTRITTTRLIL